MIVPFFDLASHVRSHRSELQAALEEVIDDGYFIGGDAVSSFEATFSKYLNVKHVAGVGNGLDAIRLILEGWGIGPGDEVIVPGFTFYATWLAVMQVGATPVFVDVETSSANLNPEFLSAALTMRTKAIIVVHLYGWTARMHPILEFANQHGIKVLEDTAQAHGAKLDGKLAGSFGDAAAFSFYPTKNLGALGDGGAVATNDEALDSFIRSRRSYGIGETKYEHKDFGWNSRLDSLQARFLSFGLTHLDDWNTARRNIASIYLGALSEGAGQVVGPADVDASVWHHFIISCNDREQLKSLLHGKGVLSDIHYPYFAGSVTPVTRYLKELSISQQNDLKVSSKLSESVISLPIGPWMSDGQIHHVANALSEIPIDLLSN